MSGSSPRAQASADGPCARCIIGAIIGSAVAAAMLFLTARAIGGLVRGVRRSSA